LSWGVRGSQFKNTGGQANDLDVIARFEPCVFQPTPDQSYFGFERAMESVAVFFNL
jgi:hypothetical protein